MILELSGKGIICEVFYLSEIDFDRFVAEFGETGIEAQIRQGCDHHFEISRGFFFDGNHVTTLKMPNAEAVILDSQSAWKSVLPNTHAYSTVVESDSDEEICDVDHSYPAFPDPDSEQVCLVVYTEFEEGCASTRFEGLGHQLPEDFRIKCFSVDCGGFVSTVTYDETIVGSEEYGCAEYAIMSFQVQGHDIPVALPEFKTSRSRQWLYRYDSEDQHHVMDYFGSKSFQWSGSATSSQGFVVRKTIRMRVEQPIAVELYRRMIDGTEVVVRLESVDAWNDIELSIPIDSELPPAGRRFSTSASDFHFNILDISPQSLGTSVSGITDLTPTIRLRVEEALDNDCWNEWEFIGTDYEIQNYRIL